LLKIFKGDIDKMYKKMCHRVTATIIIVIALALAIAVSIGHQQGAHLHRVVMNIIRFFDVMIPILAAGALVKYLMGGNGCCHAHKDQDSCHKH
jgi:hypothetical protein